MAKRPLAPLQSAAVRLRLLEAADLPLTRLWRNQPHIRRWFLNPAEITPEQHLAWYEQYRERDDDFLFIIEARQPAPRPVGQAGLYRIEWEAERAEFGRLLIGEAGAAGRGLARAATELLVNFGFARLGLAQIYLEVFADNAPARAIYERCGFAVAEQNGRLLTMIRQKAA